MDSLLKIHEFIQYLFTISYDYIIYNYNYRAI